MYTKISYCIRQAGTVRQMNDPYLVREIYGMRSYVNEKLDQFAKVGSTFNVATPWPFISPY